MMKSRSERFRAFLAHVDDGGFTIILVLGCIAALSASLVAYTRSVQLEAAYASYAYRNAQYYSVATFIGDTLAKRAGEKTTWWDRDQWNCSVGNLTIWIGVRNHSGLIDLNSADPANLAAGLRALGISSADAAATSIELESFRRRDSSAGPVSAAHLDPKYRRGPFIHPSDVYVVKALSQTEYWDVSDVFTVYSRTAAIARDLASPSVQTSLRQLQPAVNVGSVLSPYLTIKVAYIRNDKVIDSWIFDYEVSALSTRKIAVITGDMFERRLPVSSSSCTELLSPSEISLLQEVIG